MKHFNLGIAVSTIALVAASSASAQSAAPEAQGAPVTKADTTAAAQATAGEEQRPVDAGDIIVTAQRRSERLQDVPIAVESINARALESVGVSNPIDLRVAVPSFYASNGNGYLFVRLRGVGSLAGGPGLENAIASYVDGVYVGSQGGSIFSFGNVERIEVLKGPQGTLFGRNATGGLLQVITLDPKHTTSGDFSIGYGNYDTLSARGYLTGGLSDTVAADISFYVNKQGSGWGTNLFNGNDTFRTYHDVGLRAKLLFEPTSATKITLSGDYADNRNSMIGAAPLQGTTSAFTLQPVNYPNKYDLNTNHDPMLEARGGGASLRWEQDLGFATLASTTAYRQYWFKRQFDLDLSPVPFFWFSQQVQKDKQFSEELQLSSKSGKDRPLTWVLGAFYYNASGRYAPSDQTFEAFGYTREWRSVTNTYSLAGYAQGTYAITPTINLTLGARYTSELRTLSGTQQMIRGPVITLEDSVDDRRKRFNKVTFRASLDHHFTDDVLGYVSFNRGFKSGGFNTTTFHADPFAPETLDAYEAGLKTQIFDRSVTFNLAGFYYDYSNIQISTFVNGPIVIINGPSARVYGADADLSVRVTDKLRINAGVQALDGKYNSSFPNCLIGTPQGAVPLRVGQCQGNQLPVNAHLTTTLAPEYRVDLGSAGNLALTASWYHSSGWYTDPDNVIRQPAFDQFGASARWTDPSQRYSVEVWGKNLSNARSFSAQAEIQTGDHYTSYDAPRTYGLRVGTKF